MNGESGYVMIELLLMLIVVSLCAGMCVPMMNLKKKGDSVHNDFHKMEELWQREERCEIHCPKKEVMPDLISLK